MNSHREIVQAATTQDLVRELRSRAEKGDLGRRKAGIISAPTDALIREARARLRTRFDVKAAPDMELVGELLTRHNITVERAGIGDKIETRIEGPALLLRL